MVQVGDVLDCGGDEIKILYFLERLRRQALKASGKVITMNDNRETLNVERDFLYMSESGCEEFRVWAHNNMMRREPLKSSIDIQLEWNMLDQTISPFPPFGLVVMFLVCSSSSLYLFFIYFFNS